MQSTFSFPSCRRQTADLSKTDTKGDTLEKIEFGRQLIVINDGRNTHFSSCCGIFTALDLTIVSPSLSLGLRWDVLN